MKRSFLFAVGVVTLGIAVYSVPWGRVSVPTLDSFARNAGIFWILTLGSAIAIYTLAQDKRNAPIFWFLAGAAILARTFMP